MENMFGFETKSKRIIRIYSLSLVFFHDVKQNILSIFKISYSFFLFFCFIEKSKPFLMSEYSIWEIYQYVISRESERKWRLRVGDISISGHAWTSGGHMAYANLLRPEFPPAR